MPDETLSILCIGGLDPSGGAGILADARACAAFGAFALGVATAIVPQNSQGVTQIEPIAPEVVDAQLEAIFSDIEPAAIKIGMLPGIAAAEVIHKYLRPLQGRLPIVIDTVFAPSSGPEFVDSVAIDTIAGLLFPLADIITPNALEARQLSGVEISDLDSMARGAIAVYERSRSKWVLLKGGHAVTGDEDKDQLAIDLLFDGERFMELRARRETDFEVRGTGCLLASALAAQLADGKAMTEAAQNAKVWLTGQIRASQPIGKGRRMAALG